MRKYLFLLRFEAKTIRRDPVNLFLCFFPLLTLGLSAFVFPRVLPTLPFMEALAMKTAMLIALTMILTMGGFFVGAVSTFLLLDHKDEHTLHTIAATPLGLKGYLAFKMAYIYLLAVLGTLLVLLGTKALAGDTYQIAGVRMLDRLGFLRIAAFALSSSLFAPALSLLQAAFARNKVEGFAWIKGAGIVALIPVLLVLPAFSGGMQYLLCIFPNFWAAKGILTVLYPAHSTADLGYGLYMAIGAAYNLLILYAAFRFFLKRQQY